MNLKIFDVEHGACALLTCDNGTRLMIDCGHNATTDWRPGTYLRRQGITSLEMLAITNYDEDHVSGISNLFDNVAVQWIRRNTSVSAATIRKLKSVDGMGGGIERLASELSGFCESPNPQPDFQGLILQNFWNFYPTFTDENNLSLVLHLSCYGTGVMFTGDLEEDGWKMLLKEADFRRALENTSVLIAPHHGRKSGCCADAFKYCSPYFVVISDKGYMYETQDTIPFYAQRSKGGPFREGARKVLTTRNDGLIEFNFWPERWSAR